MIAFTCSADAPGKERNFILWGKHEFNDCCGPTYDPDYDDPRCRKDYYCTHSEDMCLKCFLDLVEKNPERTIEENQFYLIPSIPDSFCEYCFQSTKNKVPAFYRGYLEFLFFNDRPFLKRQLHLTEKYPTSQIYWIETSEEAANINDIACKLFRELFDHTALKYVGDRYELLNYFPWSFYYAEALRSDWEGLLHVAIPGSCFHFTDYYHSAKMLRKYAKATFFPQYYEEIHVKLDEILDELAPLFLKMYQEGLKTERIPEFEQECEFIDMAMGLPLNANIISSIEVFSSNATSTSDSRDFLWDINSRDCQITNKMFDSWAMNSSLVPIQKETNETPKWLLPEVFFQNGVFFNDHLLYQDAIYALSQAIALDPKNREYFIERAAAYFETNQIDLALKDYETAKQLSLLTKKDYFHSPLYKNVAPPSFPAANFEFASGMVQGVLKGGHHSAVEFVPSVLTCCRGILFGLWSFACSPQEVCQEFISEASAFGDFLSQASCEECIGIFVPEVIELKRDWSQLSDHDKGYRFGWIIGRYGVDVFIPVGSLKAVAKFRALKQANTLLTA